MIDARLRGVKCFAQRHSPRPRTIIGPDVAPTVVELSSSVDSLHGRSDYAEEPYPLRRRAAMSMLRRNRTDATTWLKISSASS